MRFKFLSRRTVRRVVAPMKPLGEEFNRALRAEEVNPTSAADEKIMIVRAAVRVSESALDDAVPDLKRAEAKSPGPLVLEDALEFFERRSAATARCMTAMEAMGQVARRLGVSKKQLYALNQEILEDRMLHAAGKDAKADDSDRPFDDRLLAAAQARAVSLQKLARAAVANETLGVPEVAAAARANAAISVARRLEDQILGPTQPGG